MLKIIVFDGGWGGELVADYLQEELNVLEIVRVIDWKNAPYDSKSIEEIEELVQKALLPYIGCYDAIVLAGYTTSLALDSLRRKYPRQEFIGMGVDWVKVSRSQKARQNIAVLAGRSFLDSEQCRSMQEFLPNAKFCFANSADWAKLIDENKLTKEYMYKRLRQNFSVVPRIRPEIKNETSPSELPLRTSILLTRETPGLGYKDEIARAVRNLSRLSSVAKKTEDEMLEIPDTNGEVFRPDAVLIMNTHYLGYKVELEEIFGWRVRVLDFREKLLHDVCVALGFKGVDGKLRR